MKRVGYLLVVMALMIGVSSCEEGFTCEEGSNAITEATDNYTDAISSGGDGTTECLALQAALQKLIDESECPQQTRSMTQDLLDALDCD